MKVTRERALYLTGILSSALVPLYLLRQILRGTPMQFNDYFGMFGSIFTPTGTFTPAGLLVHQNEHLVAIPKLIYVVNSWAFGGSNVSLGVFVWLVSAITVVVVFVGLRDVFRVSPSTQVVLAWVLAVFIFPLSAQQNYLAGMSGTVWILANLFALCAVLAAAKRRPLTAALFGVLGTFTYGTGLAIWPALVLILVLQRRFSIRDALMLVIGALSIVIERLTETSVGGHPPIATDPILLMRSVVIATGSLLSDSVDISLFIGALSLGLAGFLIFRAKPRWTSSPPVAALIALLAFTIIVFAMLALSRTGFGDAALLATRYMAVVAFFVLALALLSLVVLGESSVWRWSAATIVLLSLVAAIPIMNAFQNSIRQQDVAAIAARLGVAEGIVLGYQGTTSETLKSRNQYPFNQAGDQVACGLLDSTLDPSQIGPAGSVNGWVEMIEASANDDAVLLTGWAQSPSSIECVLVLDERNRVVGGAVGALPADPNWSGVARGQVSDDLRVIVRLEGEPSFHLLPGVQQEEA